MSISLTNGNNDGNKDVVEVIMARPKLQHLERRGKMHLWYGIILLNALNIVMMIHMLNVIIVMQCMHVIHKRMEIQL